MGQLLRVSKHSHSTTSFFGNCQPEVEVEEEEEAEAWTDTSALTVSGELYHCVLSKLK